MANEIKQRKNKREHFSLEKILLLLLLHKNCTRIKKVGSGGGLKWLLTKIERWLWW